MANTTTPVLATSALASKQTKATKAKKPTATPSEDVEAVLNSFKAESDPAPPQPAPVPAPAPSGDDSDEEDEEYKNAMLVIQRKKKEKAEQKASKNIETYREARREVVKARVRDLEAKRETIDRAISDCGEELNSIDRGDYDAEIIKGLGDQAEKIKIVAGNATAKRTPTAGQTDGTNAPRQRTKSERTPWANLTTRPVAVRFTMGSTDHTADVQNGLVICRQTKLGFPDPQSWCSNRVRLSGNGTQKSIYKVGFCLLAGSTEWRRLGDSQSPPDWNF